MKKFLFVAFSMLFTVNLYAQKTVSIKNDADEVVKIWDNSTAPHSSEEKADEALDGGVNYVHTSETVLYVYKSKKENATGQAVVICPGGGYGCVCMKNEGFGLAKYFQSIGVTAVILKYRLPNNGHKQVPLEDAQEALKWTRNNSKRLNIDPQKVGICGSSAGGHLAAYTSNFTADAEKPAFTILFYPVITGTTWLTHQGTFSNLLGNNRTAKMQEYYSLENRVTGTTPPAILILADDDKVVPPISSILYYQALKNNGVKASLHIYPSGGHGFAGSENYKYKQEYQTAIADWLSGLNR